MKIKMNMMANGKMIKNENNYIKILVLTRRSKLATIFKLIQKFENSLVTMTC
jgi:hypothetical protein